MDCAEAERGEDDGNAGGLTYVSHTYDLEREARLWRDSLSIAGLNNDTYM